MAIRPRQVPERLSRAFARAHRSGRLVRHRARRADTAREARELLGPEVDGAAAAALYEESGGNPVLPRAARALARPRTNGSRARRRGVARRRRGAAGRRRRADRGARAAVGRRASCARGGRGRRRPVRARADGRSRRRERGGGVRRRSTSCCAATSCAPPTCPAAFASATRSCAGPSTTPRPAAGDSARTSAAPRRWRRAALRLPRWPTTSSARRATATPRRSPSCARRETQPLSARRPPPHAGSRRRCGSLGEAAPPDERVELLIALAGAQAATGQFAEARAALLEAIELLPADAGARRVQLTAGCAGSSSCSVATTRRTPASSARSRGSPTPRRARPSALMITLAMDAFYRQARRDSRDWGARRSRSRGRSGTSRWSRRPPPRSPSPARSRAPSTRPGCIEPTRPRWSTRCRTSNSPSASTRSRYLTGAEAYMDRFEESDAHGRRGLAVARATGQGDPGSDADAGPGDRALRAGPASARGPS